MVTVEQLNSADVDKLHNLASDVPEFRVNKKTVNFWSKPVLISAANSNDVFIFVAKQEDTIIGFILASYSNGLRKATIENIYVQPKFRDQGISDSLLAELSKKIISVGCEYIATLIPVNAVGAENLYLRAGFTKGETFLWLDKPLSKNFIKR